MIGFWVSDFCKDTNKSSAMPKLFEHCRARVSKTTVKDTNNLSIAERKYLRSIQRYKKLALRDIMG